MTHEIKAKRDWRRVPGWGLVGLLAGIAAFQIPNEYHSSPGDIAAMTMVISISWAALAALVALVITTLSKSPTKTAVPFAQMNLTYSLLTTLLVAIAFAGKVFAPLTLTALIALIPLFWISRGVGRPAAEQVPPTPA